MELKTIKVYVPTDAKDELGLILKTWSGDTEGYVKKQSLYTFTKEELERVIRFVYNSAIDYENQSMGSFLNDDVPNLNTLINQILK